MLHSAFVGRLSVSKEWGDFRHVRVFRGTAGVRACGGGERGRWNRRLSVSLKAM